MKIAGTEVSLLHKAFEIYLSGCKYSPCHGCHNPELWSFDFGVDVDVEKIAELISKINELKEEKLIEYVWILGGEPLDNNLY